jgi:hypothetical protein
MRFHAAFVGATAVLAVAMAPLPARAANPLDDLIKPEKDSSACFTRVYDPAHLRAHPKQKTAAMTMWLKYEPTGGAAPALVLSIALSIIQRGDTAALFSQGDCNFDDRANRDTSNNRLIKTYPKESGHVCMQSARPDVFEAVSAEEGGGLILDRGKDRDTLMVYLDDRLTMVKRANRGHQRDIRFGADDRVFMLRRTNPKDCAVVEEAVTTPEPGVAPRQR